MTTTRCRRLGEVSSGWALMIWLLLSGDWVHLYASRPDLQLSMLTRVITHTQGVGSDTPR
jgi:hypothetical protein